MQSAKQNRLLPGFRVGHATDRRGLTGLTVILCERGAVSAVDVRGGAAGTRDLETCRPGHIAERAHAILLTGGSAFGLDSAAGVMRFLESRGVGFAAGPVRVPIVPAACIFDLNVGSPRARPDAAMAMRACRAAAGPGGRFVAEGSVGAGTGATVGKINGIACAMKGGVGFYSVTLPPPGSAKAVWTSSGSSFPRRRESPRPGHEDRMFGGGALEFRARQTAGFARKAGKSRGGATVQALAVVNALGDVLNPSNGSILAGARKSPRSREFVGTTAKMLQAPDRKVFSNTTLVVIMTDAVIPRQLLPQLTRKVHKAFIRTIFPVHTRFDGDLVFGLSLGRKKADVKSIGAEAVEAAAQAISRAVLCARGLGGLPSVHDLARMRK
ncbi:MAG: P1 family peptidase [Deltaproteobacteria bacterium]